MRTPSYLFAASGALLAACLGACGDSGNTPGSGGNSSSSSASGGTSSSSGTSNSSGTSSSGGSSSSGSSSGATSTKASDLVASWTLGWNLGNSLDAYGGGAQDETYWGNPAVTQDLLNEVASAGFKVVRIPVTWAEHLGAAPTYTIDTTWMSRVDTVVNYALKAGLDVIINIHHDGNDDPKIAWLNVVDSTGAVTDANTKAVTTEFTAVWTQIATHFKNFDNHLVFESMNEIHHGYATPDASWLTIVNNLNQTFVTTVRGTGGNNASRFLVIPGYNTSIDQTVAGFKAPTDTAQDHLILSYHYYDPWTFTIADTASATFVWGAGYTEGDAGPDNWGQESYVTAQFDKIKTNFIDKGLPTIMGEYSGVYRSDTYEKYRRYWTEYVTKAAHDRGIAPIYWDNGGVSNGSAVINRTNNTVAYTDIMDALKRAGTSSYTLAQVAPPK